ncbi:hypothetical protein [Thauera sp.]|uniref:hypothetical protein n=1 Tax=Thauera sp. TaxID=1905334 RepID=UPI0039E32AAA
MNRCSPTRYPLSRVVKFGDTSHGLYDAETGNITTPDGVVIPCPSEPPFGTDSFVVRVPGTPPLPPVSPEEAAADTAAGRTWLDYGIISGANRRMYGARLARRLPSNSPESAWIYVDEDGARWLVRIRNIIDGARFFRLTFRKFGHIEHGQAVGEVVQTIDVPSSLSLDVITRAREFHTSMHGRPYRACIEAISSRGHRVVVLSHQYDYTESYGTNGAIAFEHLVSNGLVDPVQHTSASIGSRGAEIELQGVPPNVEATVRPLISGTSSTPQSLDVLLWHGDGSGGIATTPAVALPGDTTSDVFARTLPPGTPFVPGWSMGLIMTMPPGVITYNVEGRRLVGAYYDNDDDLQLVDVVFTGQVTTSHNLSLHLFEGASSTRYTAITSVEISGDITLSCADGVSILYSVTESYESSTLPGEGYSATAVNYAVGSVSGAVNYGSVIPDFPNVQIAPTGFAVGVFDGGLNRVSTVASTGLLRNVTGDSMIDRYVSDIFLPTTHNLFEVLPLRFGSRCWGLGVRDLDDGQLHLLMLASPQQYKLVHKSGVTAADLGWACAHPVTGEIIDGPTARCFI